MIIELFYHYSTLLYRLTLFAILSRELYNYIVSYGIPFLQELIVKQAEEQELLLLTRNNLRQARLRAEKDLMSQTTTITLAEQSIEQWYQKIIPQRKEQEAALILFNQQIQIIRTQRAAHAKELSIKKQLLHEAFTQSLTELTQEQAHNNTKALDDLINNLSINQFE